MMMGLEPLCVVQKPGCSPNPIIRDVQPAPSQQSESFNTEQIQRNPLSRGLTAL